MIDYYFKHKSDKLLLSIIKKTIHIRLKIMKINPLASNLGHTFGHAIESLNDYKKNIIHGEAVSIGIIIATKLSYIDGNIDKNTCDQIINHFAMIGLKMYLPQSLKKIPPKKFIAEMLKDKKTINNEMTLGYHT